jgi:hypothetical protein
MRYLGFPINSTVSGPLINVQISNIIENFKRFWRYPWGWLTKIQLIQWGKKTLINESILIFVCVSSNYLLAFVAWEVLHMFCLVCGNSLIFVPLDT